MQIIRAETFPLELPFRERYTTAAGQLDGRSVLLFRLIASNGEVGWGEGVPLTMRGGAPPETVAEELTDFCAPALLGANIDPMAEPDPGAISELIDALLYRCEQQRVSPPAKAAVDIALHDLAGRLCGLSAWRILGAQSAVDVRCNASIDAADPEKAAADAAAWRAAGFETFKIKVGTGDDLGRVAAVRKVVGAAAKIRIDANRSWDPEGALDRLERLAGLAIELVEQPCSSLDELAQVREATSVPVVADESVTSVEEAEQAGGLGACDAATLKLSKVGGPRAVLKIADRIPSYLSSSLDGPLGIAAAIHTHQAMPRVGWAASLANGLATLPMFAATYAHSVHLVGPEVAAPQSPGLGVAVDEDAVEALTAG